MPTDRLARVQEVYERALMEDTADRDGFLRDVCKTDPGLFEEVSTLLKSTNAIPDFLGTPIDPIQVLAAIQGGAGAPEPDSLSGRSIAQYEILKPIGRGGMGEVYLARDTRLQRNTALKFLPSKMRQDPLARRRFLREARLAAAIDHPYICKVYEVGEYEGVDFIAMEFVEGATLTKRLAAGPPKTREGLRWAGEIAEALEVAHAKDLVHRDLKPSNIMLTEQNHVKVMDFGLAKQLDQGEAPPPGQSLTQLTAESTTMGTLAYMSPEQLGQEGVDTRSDLFSFGIVLYEILSGTHPFRRESVFETARAILKESPEPIVRICPGIPRAAAQLVHRLLRKQANERPVNAELTLELKKAGGVQVQEFRLVGLGRLVAATAATLLLMLSTAAYFGDLWPFAGRDVPVSSIAILPFQNDTGDPELDFLVEGLWESTTYAISPFLRVADPSSARKLRDEEDTLKVATALDVDAISTGKLRKLERSLVLTVEVKRPQEDQILWGGHSPPFQRAEFLKIGETFPQHLAAGLGLVLTSPQKSQITRRLTDDPEAFELYLRGRQYYHLRGADNLRQSILLFKEATREDPFYALAHAGLSEAFLVMKNLPDGALMARQSAETALGLDPNLAETQFAYGRTVTDWDLKLRAYGTALEINPNFPPAHSLLGMLLLNDGDVVAGRDHVRQALQLDPLNPILRFRVAYLDHAARDYERAAEHYQTLVLTEPDFRPVEVRSQLAWAYWDLQRYEESVNEWAEVDRIVSEEVRTGEFIHTSSGFAGVWAPNGVTRTAEFFRAVASGDDDQINEVVSDIEAAHASFAQPLELLLAGSRAAVQGRGEEGLELFLEYCRKGGEVPMTFSTIGAFDSMRAYPRRWQALLECWDTLDLREEFRKAREESEPDPDPRKLT